MKLLRLVLPGLFLTAVLSLQAQVTLSPATKEVGAGSMQYELTVNTSTEWAASIDAAWVTLTPSTAIGTTVTKVSVSQNVSGVIRQAVLTIGNATHTIIQQPASAQGYDLAAVGSNSYGQLGNGATAAQSSWIQILHGATAVSAGKDYTHFLKTNGSLWAMGWNYFGQLGNGSFTAHNPNPNPIQVAVGVNAVSAGGEHMLFIKNDGSLWAIGNNNYGQLGRGSYTSPSFPVNIATNVTAVAAGRSHTLYVKSGGFLWAVGDNSSGQLGKGTTTGSPTPAQIATDVAAIAAGFSQSFFIKTDGTLWAVGGNGAGQLGDGSITNRSTPVQIATSVASVAAGNNHALFIKTDGSLWGMGANTRGQLGDGTLTNRSTPVQIATSVASVTAGGEHSLFLKTDGSLWGMGANTNGRLGDGSITDRLVPVPIAAGVVSIEAGETHSLILFGPEGRIGLPPPTAPSITTQPVAQIVALGQPATFSVVGSGTAPLSYQWLKAGSPIPNETTATLNLTSVSTSDVSLYSVRVTNTVGSVESNAVSLTLGTLPVITNQPAGLTVTAGQPAIFTVNVSGTAPLTYEWRLNGTPVSGATDSSYVLANSQAANAGNYSVRVTNSLGAVTSVDAHLAVTPSAPVITDMPGSRSVALGQGTTFSVSVIGSGPLTYQWLRDGVAIVGATSSSYTLGNPQAGDVGVYSVTITNSLGSVTSVAATLTLADPPPNDNFANAETMTGASTTATGTTLGATGEAGEPYHYTVSSASNSIWYRWTAPVTGTVTIDTIGSAVDTVLAVYTGTTLGALTKLGSDDGSVGLDSRLMLAVQAGTTYSVAVGGYSLSSRGPVTLRIALTGAPIITSDSLPDGTYGSLFAGYHVVATEAPVSYGAAGLPDGIALNPATGVVSGTPTQAGIFNVTLSASNAVGTGNRRISWLINKAAATVTLGNLIATHDGSPKAVTTTTSPAGLSVFVVYSGLATPPSAIGGYLVTASIDDLNYMGSATGQLLIMANVATPAHDYATFAGSAGASGSDNGTGSAARFSSPRGITVDQDGNVYVTDSSSQLIRKITPAGVVTLVAGTANESGSTDGTGSAARFFGPVGLTVDGSGNLYVAELHNNTIRKITPGNVVTTLAGSAGQAGWADGTGAAARFSAPNGLVFGPTGDLFVADSSNHVIRKVTSAGVVTTYAGQPGQYGHADGPAATALFHSPYGLAVDVAGNLYVVETGTHIVRRITPFGTVSTVAGEPGVPGSTDGTGSAAHFREPTALTIDPAGTLFVADSGNHTIRAVTGAGVVSTVAGLAGEPGSADGQGSTARFNLPYGLALARTGQLYVADTGNHTIRVANIIGASAAPMISSPLLVSGVFGQVFENYLIRATGFPTSYGASGLPAGLVLNTTTGVISGSPTVSGTFSVTISATNATGTGSATLSVVISKANASVTLDAANFIFDGTAHPATATTQPVGLAVDFTYNGFPNAPAAAGTYNVAASINDANYQGFATGTLTIARASAGITLGGLTTIYNGTPRPVTAATTPNGLSVILTYDGSETAPTVPGSYVVEAIIDDASYEGSATGTLVISKAPAVVVLNNLTTTYNGAPQTVNVTTAPAGLTVSVTYDGSATPPTNAGSYPVTATVSDAFYVGSVTGTLVINKAPATVTLGALTAVYTSNPQAPTASTSPGGLNVELTFAGSTTPPTNAGTYAVTGTIDELNYFGSATDTFIINKATPQLTWADPAAITYGTVLSAAQLNASADVPGSFTYDPVTGTLLNAGTHMLSVTFTPTDTANYVVVATPRELTVNKAPASVTLGNLTTTYNGSAQPVSGTTSPAGLNVVFTYDGSSTAPTNAGSYVIAATVVEPNYFGSATDTLVINKATPQLTWADPAAITYGTALGAGQLNAAADVAGAFVYEPAGGAVLNAGEHTLTTTFSPADPVNYTGAGASRTLTVNKAVATVTLGSLAVTYDGAAKAVTVTTLPAGLAVTLSYAGGTTVPVDAGSYAVEAVVNEANYTGSATDTLVIAKAAQTIGFTALADRPFSLAPIALNATATSSLPVTFTLLSGPATLAGDSVTLTGSGTVNLRASQAGNDNYLAAPEVDRSFVVSVNFASWSREKFTALELGDVLISGSAADPDGDGLTNLLEYALGLEPKSAETTGLPTVSTTATDWVYTYTRPADRADLVYDVEASANLSTWSAAVVTHERTTAGATETWQATYPLASAVNVFFRLKVVQQ